jgi:hypothetical protein
LLRLCLEEVGVFIVFAALKLFGAKIQYTNKKAF